VAITAGQDHTFSKHFKYFSESEVSGDSPMCSPTCSLAGVSSLIKWAELVRPHNTVKSRKHVIKALLIKLVKAAPNEPRREFMIVCKVILEKIRLQNARIQKRRAFVK
jgi:hypothetical protein